MPYISITEAGHRLGVTRCRAWQLVQAGKLRAICDRGRWAVDVTSVDERLLSSSKVTTSDAS